MTRQNYCQFCGKKLSLTESSCSNCGEETLFSAMEEDVLFEPPIHNIGFFNFDINFEPYINSRNQNIKYYLCEKCGFLNHKDNEFCFNCGDKHNKSRFERILRKFSKETPKVATIFCEKCNGVNSANNIFCEYCGEKLITSSDDEVDMDDRYSNFNFTYDNPVFCFCGEENDIDSAFCFNCGFPLQKFNYSPKNLKILCICSHFNDIDSEFCESCGINLEEEKEVIICSCGTQNPLNAKFCANCKKPLNLQRTLKLRYVCTCGTILDFSTPYCSNCGKDIAKAIRRKKSISKTASTFKNLKRRIL